MTSTIEQLEQFILDATGCEDPGKLQSLIEKMAVMVRFEQARAQNAEEELDTIYRDMAYNDQG